MTPRRQFSSDQRSLMWAPVVIAAAYFVYRPVIGLVWSWLT